jgi:hypothetical protein
MAFSTYTGNKLLDLILRGTAFTAPAGIYVSLHTAASTDGANEVSTGAWPAYARQDATQGGALADAFDAASGKATENTQTMLYGANDGAGSVTVTHFALWDAASSGNCLWYGALLASKTLLPGDECVVKPGDLVLSVT